MQKIYSDDVVFVDSASDSVTSLPLASLSSVSKFRKSDYRSILDDRQLKTKIKQMITYRRLRALLKRSSEMQLW